MRNQNLQFSLGFLLTLTLLVAIYFAKGLSMWLLVLFTEAIFILLVVRFLYHGIPTVLIKASRDNCYRIDGSLSSAREIRERTAKAKIRSDLLVILFIVALSGNLLALAVNSVIIPLPVAADTLSVFSFDTDSWREAIRARNLDSRYSEWVAVEHAGEDRVFDPNQHFVKTSFPVVASIALAWLVGTCALIWYTYRGSLREFSTGITSRSTEYLNLDIGRMQSESND